MVSLCNESIKCTPGLFGYLKFEVVILVLIFVEVAFREVKTHINKSTFDYGYATSHRDDLVDTTWIRLYL